MEPYVIVVDDDPNTTAPLAKIARSHGYTVDVADSVHAARALFAKKVPHLMLVDVMLPDGNGIEMIKDLQTEPDVNFVVITGHSSIKLAVQSLRVSVFDYLEKPVALETIAKIFKDVAAMLASATNLQASKVASAPSRPIIGESPAICRLHEAINAVAKASASVWIQGESGTGKELVAEQIHALSGRTGKFVAVNCGAISEELGISELFGHEKGSFTGAQKRQIGHFEQADGGTIFLDEITEMSMETQVYLLRVLESSRLRRLGGADEIAVDVRVVAATNRRAKDAISEGLLRQDLYFRIAEFPIEVPPLRDRGDDVLLIAESIRATLNDEYGTHKKFDEKAAQVMRTLPWRGNVRELKNVIHRAFLMSENSINSDIFSLSKPLDAAEDGPAYNITSLIGKSFWEVEKELIFATLEYHGGDKTKTAKTLGISLKTLYNRLNAYM